MISLLLPVLILGASLSLLIILLVIINCIYPWGIAIPLFPVYPLYSYTLYILLPSSEPCFLECFPVQGGPKLLQREKQKR